MDTNTLPVDYKCDGPCGFTYPGHMVTVVDGRNYCRADAPITQAVREARAFFAALHADR